MNGTTLTGGGGGGSSGSGTSASQKDGNVSKLQARIAQVQAQLQVLRKFRNSTLETQQEGESKEGKNEDTSGIPVAEMQPKLSEPGKQESFAVAAAEGNTSEVGSAAAVAENKMEDEKVGKRASPQWGTLTGGLKGSQTITAEVHDSSGSLSAGVVASQVKMEEMYDAGMFGSILSIASSGSRPISRISLEAVEESEQKAEVDPAPIMSPPFATVKNKEEGEKT